MDNVGKHIIQTQNKRFQIDQLLAQQSIYSDAKILQGILIFITIPLPIIIALVIKYYPDVIDEKSWIFILYLIGASFLEKVLENLIGRLKKIAASIQEVFDLTVLLIDENKTLNNAIIDRELIRSYSKKPRQKPKRVEKVMNWYSVNVESIGTNVASLLCQRTNIYYDFSVRKRYNWLMRILVFLTFLILLIISLQNELTLKSFLIEVVVPSIPVFMFAYREITYNVESIDNLEHLKNLIEENIRNLNINSQVEHSLIRNIQDRIYHNRILSPLIPDFIYNLIRPKLEDEMNYSINEKINDLIRE